MDRLRPRAGPEAPRPPPTPGDVAVLAWTVRASAAPDLLRHLTRAGPTPLDALASVADLPEGMTLRVLCTLMRQGLVRAVEGSPRTFCLGAAA